MIASSSGTPVYSSGSLCFGDGSARKAAVAQLFVREHLAERRLRGISGDRTVLELFAPVTRFEPLSPDALASV